MKRQLGGWKSFLNLSAPQGNRSRRCTGTISYTVLEHQAGAKVTGVARGGF